MKIPRPKINRQVLSKLGHIILASLASAILFSAIIISLPQTERINQKISYDLKLKNKVWGKEYTLELQLEPNQVTERAKYIQETKDAISTRLKKYGVYDFNISEVGSSGQNRPKIAVRVFSDKDKTDIDQLVEQRYFIRFMIKKDGVNFQDSTNPYAAYDPQNYTETDFTRWSFRTVYVTKLKTTSGTQAYFAIYKPWENDMNKFDDFFSKYVGTQQGLMIDGLVNPITIPNTRVSDQYGNIRRQPFAIALSTQQKAADIQNILLNSGVIPAIYDLNTSRTLPVSNYTINMYEGLVVFVAFFIILSIIDFYLLKNKSEIVKKVFIVGFSITSYITICKLVGIPTNIMELLLGGIIFVILNYTQQVLPKKSLVINFITITPIILGVAYFITFGLVQSVVFISLTLLLISYLLEFTYPYYKDLVIKAIK